jgi:hypothetical protein
MRRNLWRLAFALVISSGCFLATVIWFQTGQVKDRSDSGKKAVARLSQASHEVQRKEVSRVIWENISRNDELFAGEAVRTTEKADADIQLLKTGTVIHLEPDSLIVLEENDNGLALDFLQGNLFVQGGAAAPTGSGGAAPGAGLTLKTGSGQIQMKSADMSLSKDQSGRVNLEVFKGQATLQQDGRKLDIAKNNGVVLSDKGVSETKERLQLLSPQAGQTVLLNLTRGQKLDLGWKPLPAGYTVAAEVGPSRSALRPLASFPGESGHAGIHQRPGKWYLRLVATSTDASKPRLTSLVTPFTVEPKAPPVLIEPMPENPVLKASPDAHVQFRWLNRNKYISQLFEVADDDRFTKVITRQALAGEVDSFETPVPDGLHYWRVTGYLKEKDKTEGLSSRGFRLEVSSSWKIQPPEPLGPSAGQRLSMAEARRKGVTLRWKAPLGVKRFKVTTSRREGAAWVASHEQETEATMLKLADVQPGTYRWTVASLDPKGGSAQTAGPFEFTIDNLPKVEWAQTDGDSSVYQFTTPTPSLATQWKAVDGASSYRYRVSAEGAQDAGPWRVTKLNSFDITVPDEGRYNAAVQALDDKGQVSAESESRAFEVKRHPLLPAPRWAEQTPEVLKSDRKGNLSLGWEEVEGARQYLILLQSPDGKLIEQKSVSRNTASLNRLKPGEYQVRVKPVDSFQRPGGESEARKVEVPVTSDIRAPKIKAMKVK